MRWPLDVINITDNYGMRWHPIYNEYRMHNGTDFGATAGTPIKAIGSGTVASKGSNGSAGNWVMINLDGYQGVTADHFHMSSPSPLAQGARFSEGDVIGYVGSTGDSTGPHLHLEMAQNGSRFDPVPWLQNAIANGGGFLDSLSDPMQIQVYNMVAGLWNWGTQIHPWTHQSITGVNTLLTRIPD